MSFLKRILKGSAESQPPREIKSSGSERPRELKADRVENAELRQHEITAVSQRWLPGIAQRLASRAEGPSNPEMFIRKCGEALDRIEQSTGNPEDREHMNLMARMHGSLEGARSMMAVPESDSGINTEYPSDLKTFFELRPEAETDVRLLEERVDELINNLRVIRPDLYNVSGLLAEAGEVRKRLAGVDTRGVSNAVAFETHLSGLDGRIGMVESVMTELLQKTDMADQGMERAA